jgi:hypothetical protein
LQKKSPGLKSHPSHLARPSELVINFISSKIQNCLLGYSILLERRSIFRYELAGMVFIILLGSALHFTFEWSDNQPIVGVFSAVNESVWEHLKIAFWPALLYLIFEYRYLFKKSNNFFLAKTSGIYAIMIIIPAIFYSYTIFFEENLITDIGSFIFAIIIGQLISYRLLTFKKIDKIFDLISLVALAILVLAFVIFTFYPPQIQLFQDPNTGGYGIINHFH